MGIREIVVFGSLAVGMICLGGCADLAHQRRLMAKHGIELSSGHRDRFSTPNSNIVIESPYTNRNFYGRDNKNSFRGRESHSFEWRRYEQEKREYRGALKHLNRNRETYNIDAHGNINLPYGQGKPRVIIEPPRKPSHKSFHRIQRR